MSTMTRSVVHKSDHFEPEAVLDPAEQRRLRGHLEQIDYATFAANREIISRALGRVDLSKFQRLASAAAHARAEWVGTAASLAERQSTLAPEEADKLTALRVRYEELREAYQALRRMVERGYCPFSPSVPNGGAR